MPSARQLIEIALKSSGGKASAKDIKAPAEALDKLRDKVGPTNLASRQLGLTFKELGRFTRDAFASFSGNDLRNMNLSTKSFGELGRASNNLKKAWAALSINAKTMVIALGAIATAVLATVAAFKFFTKVIPAAANQQEAINRVAIAFTSLQRESRKAVKDMVDFADEMQRTTRFTDNQVLASTALLAQLGRLTGEGLKEAARAAADLAIGLGRDLPVATLILAKAAQGSTFELAKYGIIIDQNLSRSEKWASVLRQVQARFGGSAAQDLGTFNAALKQLSGAWQDLLEVFGAPFIGIATAAIKDLSRELFALADLIGKLPFIKDKLLPPAPRLLSEMRELRTLVGDNAKLFESLGVQRPFQQLVDLVAKSRAGLVNASDALTELARPERLKGMSRSTREFADLLLKVPETFRAAFIEARRFGNVAAPESYLDVLRQLRIAALDAGIGIRLLSDGPEREDLIAYRALLGEIILQMQGARALRQLDFGKGLVGAARSVVEEFDKLNDSPIQRLELTIDAPFDQLEDNYRDTLNKMTSAQREMVKQTNKQFEAMKLPDRLLGELEAVKLRAQLLFDKGEVNAGLALIQTFLDRTVNRVSKQLAVDAPEQAAQAKILLAMRAFFGQGVTIPLKVDVQGPQKEISVFKEFLQSEFDSLITDLQSLPFDALFDLITAPIFAAIDGTKKAGDAIVAVMKDIVKRMIAQLVIMTLLNLFSGGTFSFATLIKGAFGKVQQFANDAEKAADAAKVAIQKLQDAADVQGRSRIQLESIGEALDFINKAAQDTSKAVNSIFSEQSFATSVAGEFSLIASSLNNATLEAKDTKAAIDDLRKATFQLPVVNFAREQNRLRTAVNVAARPVEPFIAPKFLAPQQRTGEVTFNFPTIDSTDIRRSIQTGPLGRELSRAMKGF